MMALHTILERSLHQRVFKAAMEGNADKIRTSLSGLPDEMVKKNLHHFHYDGIKCNTPLSIAAYYGNRKVVQLLVSIYNVDVDQEMKHSRSLAWFSPALVSSALSDHLDIVKFLVTKGCDVNIRDHYKHTALFEACLLGNLDMVTYLVENGADIEASDPSGRTCLMVSCRKENAKVVQYVLAKGADPNREAAKKITALHVAVLENATQVVRLLLEKGAIMTANEDGVFPLNEAAASKCVEIVEVFLGLPSVTREEKIDALELLGARMARADISKAFRYLRRAMVERHRDPSCVVSKPHSPLPLQSGLEESRTLEELEARRLDHYTLHSECLAIVDRLLGHSAHVTISTYHSYLQMFQSTDQCTQALGLCLHLRKTPRLHCSYTCSECESVFFDTTRKMLQKGESVPFSYIQKFLTLATKKIRKDVIDLRFAPRWAVISFLFGTLLGIKYASGQEEGRQLQNSVGGFISMKAFLPWDSPPHVAVSLYWDRVPSLAKVEALPYAPLIFFLLQCGANVHARDPNGNGPLHVIAGCPKGKDGGETQCRIARTLLEAGALVGVRNKSGRMPLDCAVAESVKGILREHYPPSLKSLAANSVVRERIPFASEIPQDLKDFIRLH